MDVKKLVAGSILFGSLACAGMLPVEAQEMQRAATDTRADAPEARDYDDRDDGFDWGLLGLLGLLGLIPRKRTEVVHRNDTRPNTNGPNRT